jgi:predicted permease
MLRVVVAAQVAVSMVLVATSLMFAKSLQNISNTDLGFKRDNLLLADLNLAGAGIRGEQKDIFLKHLLDNLNAAPGIASASLSRLTPLSGLQWWDVAAVPGYTPARDEATTIYINQVTPAYFQTLGIPLVEGREFTPSDDHGSRRVAIVSQSFARRFYQDRPALGRVFSVGPGAGADPNYEMFRNLQIVGIVADTKYSDPHEAQKDVVYFASYQAGIFDMRGSLEIRLAPGANGSQGSKQIRNEVNRLASGLEADIRPYSSVFERSLQRDRLLAVLAGIFGLVGLVLACIGLYGVMAHTVAARTGEIGIRMTLGARGLQVEWMVVREALLLAGTGAIVGVPLALASGQLARGLLYGLEPSDQVVFAASLGIMIVVSAAAAWIPARRAARVDPMFALRHE